jgi:hypothetical protein
MEPLDEVKQNLEGLLSSTPSETPTQDKVFNVFPFFAKGYYKHQPIHYGPKYGASNAQIKG